MEIACLMVDPGDDEGFEGGSPPSLMPQGHYLAGFVVLVQLLPRIFAQITSPAPPIVPASKAIIAFLGHGLHLALHAFMLVQPILGILQVNHAWRLASLPWVGWSLPALIGEAVWP